MLHRFAVMVALGALGASSVAPAQVAPLSAEPLKPAAMANPVLPTNADEPLVAVPTNSDPLANQGSEAAPSPEAEPVTRGASLAESVSLNRSSEAGSRELECLAAGVYFESKSEPLAGQLAVGQVIANRANSKGRFPSTYCGVLMQRGQFSFIRGGRWPAVNKNSPQWKNAVAIARIVDQDLHDSSVGKALFFHAKRVSPGWRLTRVASVGNHVFYR
ncbi:cell wall hydrolase [Sphingomonas arenae]|uniref:cell wall hydrolase n=1 Tax=Sphingomonas arenae TaxID=2812555 RepID=UPI001F39A0F2|nr:cell wall hydrolase [Sphingomonas arenae]